METPTQINLSEETLTLLAEETNLSQNEIEESFKDFNKIAKDGKLDVNGFLEMNSAIMPGENSSKFIQLMFNSFDQDGDGYLDFSEYLKGMVHIDSMEDKDGFVKFFFKINDRDKSNGIDREELKKFISLMIDLRSQSTKEEGEEEAHDRDETVKNAEEIQKEIDDLKVQVDKMQKESQKIDKLVHDVFSKYDLGSKGFLNEEEFSQFYSDF